MNSKDETEKILALVPVKNRESIYREDGLIDLLSPRFKIKFLQKLIPKSRDPYIHANLDELGSATWELIDGARNIEEIAMLLEEKFSEQIHPVHQRLTLFLRQLYQNGFIIFRD